MNTRGTTREEVGNQPRENEVFSSVNGASKSSGTVKLVEWTLHGWDLLAS